MYVLIVIFGTEVVPLAVRKCTVFVMYNAGCTVISQYTFLL